ncbi:MAG: 8-amino-7-oxononanoate synthase [Desulforegulaceae bacterium]|nr:8-amino-7-oxononanoate synthase [Desulforegulaceae bacterium]
MEKFDFYTRKLESRKKKNQKRSLVSYLPLKNGRVEKNGEVFLNLSSNDYLGLSFNEKIIEKGCEYARKFGAGTGASRLVTGSSKIFFEVEEKISKLKNKDKSIVLNSGYQANIGVISSLASRKSIIFSDYLNHNSIIKGALLSRAELRRFRHNDLNHLEEMLKKTKDKKYSSKIIVTESVFSMDGDIPDLEKIADLSEEYGCIFLADEAHSTGIFGENSMGLAKRADISIGTFGKGGGSFGAYVSCSEEIYEYFVNFCEALIFSTSLPPFNIGAISAFLDLIPKLDDKRAKLLNNSNALRKGLKEIGFDLPKGITQIIPVITGSEKSAIRLSEFLKKRKILCVPIRPPTVPENMSRIRLSLSAAHNKKDIDYILGVFDEYKKK